MAAAVAHFVPAEVIEGFVSTFWEWTMVPMMRIEAIVNVAIELVWPVKPGTGSEEHAAVEPLGSVVPVWGAVVGGDIVVAVRTSRLWSDIDGDLGGAWDAQHSAHQDKKCKEFRIMHKFLLTRGKSNSLAKVAK
jgi:hypothetical protein